MAHATVSRCLARRGLSRRPPAPREQVRRFEWPCPGDLLQMDTKRLARFSRPGHTVTGDRSPHQRGASASASAGSSATRSSTTTPAWPTPRSTATRKPRPSPRFVAARPRVLRRHDIQPKRLQTDNAWCYIRNRSLRELLAAPRDPPPPDPAAHPKRNGKDRALPADPRPRMGLRAALPQLRRPRRSAPDLARPLQHHPQPQLTLQPATHQPRSEPTEAQETAAKDHFAAWPGRLKNQRWR